jgi:hypothetical protein
MFADNRTTKFARILLPLQPLWVYALLATSERSDVLDFGRKQK